LTKRRSQNYFIDGDKFNMTEQKVKIDADELSAYLKSSGKTFSLCKERYGLVEGNGKDHSQACPICGGNNRFWFSEEYDCFFCRKCPPMAGQKQRRYSIYDLESHCNHVTSFPDVLVNIAGACGHVSTVGGSVAGSPRRESEPPKAKTNGKPKQFQDGTIKKTEYIYTDESGNHWHKVTRLDGIDSSTGEPAKTFSQSKIVNGLWATGAPGVIYPYRLPDTLKAKTLFIGEGEKVCDCANEVLRTAGNKIAIATTSPMGAQNGHHWKDFMRLFPILTEKKIRILPDNDTAGWKYAKTVAAAILESNPSADVKIVPLPGLPDGGDFCEWYADWYAGAGHVLEGSDREIAQAAITELSNVCQRYGESVTAESLSESEPPQADSGRSNIDPSEKIGIDVLDSFLQQIEKISFSQSEDEKVGHNGYYIGSIDHLLKTAKLHQWDIGMKNEAPHFFTGEFWQRIEMSSFRRFLQAVGIRQGVPYKIIKDHMFADKLVRQFASEARFPILTANDTQKINLRNGTLHFTPGGIEMKSFDKQDGLTYQLHYDYNPSATAPLFRKFIDRVLPDNAVQKLIFQYIGYVFLRNMNLEKILFLYGGGANGKSVFLNVIRGLIGHEQCCEYSLEGITKSEYQRAELGNYLFNVSTEISTRMELDIFKKVASREALQGRYPYGRSFNIHDYATSVFATNELPKDVEQTVAFFRRFIIIPFDVRIPDNEQDPDLTRKIIKNEMSGVLNFVIDGMKSLLERGKFDIPENVRLAVEKFQQDSDSVLSFLDENRYRPSVANSIPLRELYDSYKAQCIDDGRHPLSKPNFVKRLCALGYTKGKVGHDKQVVIFADCADYAD
jgi:putative DNA primase/helicase